MASLNPDLTPVLPPPDGQLPNFTNPETIKPAVIGVSVVLIILSTLCVLGRAYVKIRSRSHHSEDWLMYFAWACFVVYDLLIVYITQEYGLARHMWDIPLSSFSHILYYVNVIYCLYGPTMLAAKLSVLLQIKRLFVTDRSRTDVVWVTVIVMIVANAIFYTGLFFSEVFQCWPREKIWNPALPGKCVDPNSATVVAGILNLVSDIGCLMLPAWAIWHLQMSWKRKLEVFAVFGVGLLSVTSVCPC